MTAERIPAEVRPRSSFPRGSTSRRDAHPARQRPYPAATTLRCLHADVALTERTLTARAVIDATATDPHPHWPCCYCHEAVWTDRSTAAPALTDRLGALALRAFQTVAAGLRDRGITLGAREDEITVDPAVSAQLRSPEARQRGCFGGPDMTPQTGASAARDRAARLTVAAPTDSVLTERAPCRLRTIERHTRAQAVPGTSSDRETPCT